VLKEIGFDVEIYRDLNSQVTFPKTGKKIVLDQNEIFLKE
jgi:hypothetical protein